MSRIDMGGHAVSQGGKSFTNAKVIVWAGNRGTTDPEGAIMLDVMVKPQDGLAATNVYGDIHVDKARELQAALGKAIKEWEDSQPNTVEVKHAHFIFTMPNHQDWDQASTATLLANCLKVVDVRADN